MLRSTFPTAKGYCIHFKTEFIQSILPASLTSEFPFLILMQNNIINLKEEDSKGLQQAF